MLYYLLSCIFIGFALYLAALFTVTITRQSVAGVRTYFSAQTADGAKNRVALKILIALWSLCAIAFALLRLHS